MFRKGFLCLFLVLITLAAMSTAAAVEFNETADDIASACTEGTELEVNDDVNEMVESDSDASEVLSADVSDDVLRDDEWKTFTELQELIDDWDEDYVLELDCNYYCDDDFADNNYAISINKALTIDGGDYSLDACGKSAIFWIYADGVELENINFLNGIDNDKNGGGLYVMGETTIRNCFFEGCNATANGGAIFSTEKLTIVSTYFNDNNAKECGGAIYVCYPSEGGESLNVASSHFDENYAKNGGAIYLDYSTEDGSYYQGAAKSFIKDSQFDSNGAEENGGAISNFQYLDILNSVFKNNYAYENGGAVYVENGVYDEDTGISQTFGLKVHGASSFINNTADEHGGAIKMYAQQDVKAKGIIGDVEVLEGVRFEKNSADTGGALSLDSGSRITGAIFIGNHARTAGAIEGGTALDCTFKDNSAPVTSGTKIWKTVTKTEVTLIPMPYTTLYDSGKQFQVLVIDTKTGAPMNGFEVKLQIYYPDSTKYFTKTITTGSNGIASLPFSYRTPGTYKIIVSAKNTLKFKATKQTTYAKISKSTFIIKAPKVKKRYKKTVKFKITVKDKATGKGFWSADLTVKVYTGKKFKKYYLDTNKNGKATLKLKKLKKGKHKVVIRASSTEYATVLNTKVYTHTPATKTSYIIIK